MKKIVLSAYFILCFSFLSFQLKAQVGKVGINTTDPKATLHVKDSSVLFTGDTSINAGNPPVSDAGTRMMWYPDKAAFRAGMVTGNQWNKDSVGLFSVAMGRNTIASGTSSTAMGDVTTAAGSNAISMGSLTRASGDNSAVLGLQNTSRAFASLTIGQFNDSIAGSNPTSWVDTDPVFVIGNGTDDVNRSNAFVVNKNGNTIISGEVNRPSSGTANLVPIAYGSVSGDGTILNSGTQNFSVFRRSNGEYEITLTGITYTLSGFISIATVLNSFTASPTYITVGEQLGALLITTFNSSGTKVSARFHFVVYRP